MPYEPTKDKELLNFFISVENPRKKGMNRKTKRFKAFKVERSDGVEEWNVGYGHKIDGPDSPVYVNGREIFVGPNDPGISEFQAIELKKQDIRVAEKKLRAEIKKYNPFRDGTTYDELSPPEKSLFIDIVFNVGTIRNKKTGKFGWPDLIKGISAYKQDPTEENLKVILQESERAGLTDRNTKIHKFFGPRFKTIAKPKQQKMSTREIFLQMKQQRDDSLRKIFSSLRNTIEQVDKQEAEMVEEEEEEEEVGEVEAQDKQDLKLDAGIYERPDGSLFQISDTMEVIELRGATNGESQASK